MLNVAAVFSDHMVLQRRMPIRVFGEADGPVRVALAGVEVEAAPGADGRFCAELPAMEASGPYTMRVACGDDARVFRDVMIGEVWLCGGQSNMEFRLRDDAHGPEQVATGDDVILRFYTVNQEPRVDAAMLARERETQWLPLSPGECGDVSAVAYYAGRRLREALGVPVGMLICCIGGTEISNWMSREALAETPGGAEMLAKHDAAVAQVTDEQFEKDEAAYAARVQAWCDVAGAMKAEKPGVRAEEIVAKAGDFPWPPPTGRWMLRRPGGPWETMVGRIAPYGARGLLWYQGETDSGNAEHYDARFARMIDEWREVFKNDKLAVVAAQLPNYAADPANEDWPAIRRAQQAVCDAVPDCALACLIDCGDSRDLHPWDKEEPGRRMADAALKLAYGVGDGARSPRLEGVTPAEGGLLLRFTKPLGPIRGTTDSLRADGKPARAHVTPEGALLVEAPGAKAVDYAWQNDPAVCLFGTDGLPVLPFEWENGTACAET